MNACAGCRIRNKLAGGRAGVGFTTLTPPTPAIRRRGAALGATAALIALIALSVAWEWWLAPLRPGGTALVLKAVPLLLALPGVLRRRLYTLQWASMLILLYFAEGIVRGMSDRGLSARLGWLETAACAGVLRLRAGLRRAVQAGGASGETGGDRLTSTDRPNMTADTLHRPASQSDSARHDSTYADSDLHQTNCPPPSSPPAVTPSARPTC